MPPANSRSDNPPSPSRLSPSASASHLPPLDPGIPDLDRVLMSNPEDDVHDENVRFLRARRAGNAFQHSRMRRMNTYEAETSNASGDTYRRRNAQVGGVTGRRIPVVRRPRDSDGHEYDGASGLQMWDLLHREELDLNERNNMESLVGEMWHSRYPRGEAPQSTQIGIEEQMLEPYISSMRYGGATAALLESVRRQARLPAASRMHGPGDADDQEPELERRPVPWTTTATSGNRSGSIRTAFPLHLSDSRNAHIREMYIKDPSVHRLKEAIKYLDRVRFSSSYEESLTEAALGGFVKLEYFLSHESDFVLDTGFIPSPPASSWIRPGSVFSGFQHATQNTRIGPFNRSTDPVIVNGSESNRITVSTSHGRRYWARNSVDLNAADEGNELLAARKMEHWPVKVTIHDVDLVTMTLSGTMEAYNIPDKSDPEQKSHIVTFLEGEIIDFNTHTLQTKNFKAGADIDTCYWKKLEPFKDMTPDEIVKNLVSKKWITEYLAEGWILMRWKERCFVSPSHDQQGLTISGFYYVSVRRDNGHVEGMYHDPGSTPFQQLKLEPELKQRMVFPAYEFR